jgi:hypothetical protein
MRVILLSMVSYVIDAKPFLEDNPSFGFHHVLGRGPVLGETPISLWKPVAMARCNAFGHYQPI